MFEETQNHLGTEPGKQRRQADNKHSAEAPRGFRSLISLGEDPQHSLLRETHDNGTATT